MSKVGRQACSERGINLYLSRLPFRQQTIFPTVVSGIVLLNARYLYPASWTKAQVLARSHPNVLATSAWMNNLYQVKSGGHLDGVDLSVPLSYADRFRIRQPGGHWDRFPPHVDGQILSSLISSR
jgi:hypothetical protein